MNDAPALKYCRHGFDDSALGSPQTFRAIFAAMEHPGQLVTIGENPNAPDVLNPACAATCLTLLACETPVWTDVARESPAISWLQFGCGGAVVTESCMANFAIITKPATMPALECFRVGLYKYPDKATTIVIQVDDILPSAVNKDSNIFFDNTVQLDLKGVPNKFWNQWRQLSGLYPLGIDIFITCDDVLMALPKIQRIESYSYPISHIGKAAGSC